MSTAVQVVFDAADPHALAQFWALALRYQQEDHSVVVAQLLEAGHVDDHDHGQLTLPVDHQDELLEPTRLGFALLDGLP